MKSNASPQRLSCGITEAQEEEAMFGSIMHRQGEQAFAHDPALRGYHAVYREGEINHCPGCGRSHWIIGRFSAECGFCEIGRASCRERVCQYVYISMVAVYLKKK